MTLHTAPPAVRRGGGLWPFLAATFGLTWGLGLVGLLFADAVRPVFEPLFHLAVAAPSLAAFGLALRREGRAGVLRLLRAGLRWRVGARWYLVPFVLIPAMGLGARLLADAAGGAVTLSPAAPLALLAAAPLALLTDPGPLGEEFGFRGWALPRLAERFGWRAGALVLGGIWAVWHLPAFVVAGTPQNDLPLAPMVVQWFATSVLFAWTTLRTGSVLVGGILPHLTLNLCGTVLGASPWWTAPLYAAVAAVLLVRGRAGVR